MCLGKEKVTKTPLHFWKKIPDIYNLKRKSAFCLTVGDWLQVRNITAERQGEEKLLISWQPGSRESKIQRGRNQGDDITFKDRHPKLTSFY